MGQSHRQQGAEGLLEARCDPAVVRDDVRRRLGGIVHDRHGEAAVGGQAGQRRAMGAGDDSVNRQDPVEFGQGLAAQRHHGFGVDVAIGRSLAVPAGNLALRHGHEVRRKEHDLGVGVSDVGDGDAPRAFETHDATLFFASLRIRRMGVNRPA